MYGCSFRVVTVIDVVSCPRGAARRSAVRYWLVGQAIDTVPPRSGPRIFSGMWVGGATGLSLSAAVVMRAPRARRAVARGAMGRVRLWASPSRMVSRAESAATAAAMYMLVPELPISTVAGGDGDEGGGEVGGRPVTV